MFALKEYKRLCQKNESENYLFDKYIFRRVSVYFSIVFIKLGISANQATFLSLLAALGSLFFLTSNHAPMMLAAAGLILAYYMLDHVDGELARYYTNTGLRKPSLQGQYFDVLIHRYSTNLMLFFMGVSVYRLFDYRAAVLLGFIACVGMSSFPNLVAAQVIIHKIAGDNRWAEDRQVNEALYLIEKKKEQIKRANADNLVYKCKKILSEMLFFPGCLLLIAAVVLLDVAVPVFEVFSHEFNLRFLLLWLMTPVYVLNTVRQSLKWMSVFDKIEPVSGGAP